jgi:TolB-like protein
MSANAENEYFSDGLTETLLHMLAQLEDLKVAARTSSFAFKGMNLDIREIAQELGVAHVLEGSVQRAGDQVRVTAQLIRADDGFHVWSHNYDRKVDDIFAIQDQISADVAAALGSSLLPAQNDSIQGVDTDDFRAYDLYLQALEQQNIASNDALIEAQRLFVDAIDLDPGFIDAKLGLARNYIWQWYKDVDDADRFDLTALELIDEVREQRPDSRTAQLMGLLMQFYIGRSEQTHWGFSDESRALVDDMLEIARSGNVDSFLIRAVVSIISGVPLQKDEEALELLRAALEADPLNYELLWAQATLFRITDRPEEARQPLLTAARVAPQNPMIRFVLGNLALEQGEFGESLDWRRQATLLDPDDPVLFSRIARAFYDVGLIEEGDHWFGKVRAMNPDPCQVWSLEAHAADAAGDHDRLIERTSNDLAAVVLQPNFCYFPIDYFIWTMSELGRSQQAIDYLEELIPDIYSGTAIADNRRQQYIQGMAMWLHSDVMDKESYQSYMKDFLVTWDAAFPDWREISAPIYEISFDFVTGEADRAKSLFLETYTHNNFWRWKQLLNYPWLAEFRKDPEVATRIDEYLQRKTRFAEEAHQLLDQPEWQH